MQLLQKYFASFSRNAKIRKLILNKNYTIILVKIVEFDFRYTHGINFNIYP